MSLAVSSGAPLFAQEKTLDPASVNANSVSEETFAVTGLSTDWQVKVDAPSLEAGLVLLNAAISAADTLKLYIWNTTNAAINPASQSFRIVCR